MTLAEAIAQWVTAMARDDSVSQERAESRALSLSVFAKYAGSGLRLDEITPAGLRDFLARWVIENQDRASLHAGIGELIESLAAFIEWAGRIGFTATSECLSTIAELRDRVPRAILIGSRLSDHLAGGAISFPEFLTSFVEGGHSEYDLDAPGDCRWLEGYFRIIRVEGQKVEAEELLTETRAWPIRFPEDVAVLLAADYLINLELAQAEDYWQIVACGFAYPPGTEI